MNSKIKSALSVFLSTALLSAGAVAQEKNYGKEKPTSESVIEEFKSPVPGSDDSVRTGSPLAGIEDDRPGP